MVLIFLSLGLLFSAAACQSSDKVGKRIEKNLTLIVDNKKAGVSSNPNTYIEQQQQLYDEIVSTGSTGLRYLTEQLKESKNNGLREWIMAKACQDILKENSPVKEWSSGKEWISKYEQSK